MSRQIYLNVVLKGSPWQSSGQDSAFSLLWAWVQSVVRELLISSCKPCNAAKKKKGGIKNSTFAILNRPIPKFHILMQQEDSNKIYKKEFQNQNLNQNMKTHLLICTNKCHIQSFPCQSPTFTNQNYITKFQNQFVLGCY